VLLANARLRTYRANYGSQVKRMLYRPCGRLKKKKEKRKSILKTNKDCSKLEERIYFGNYKNIYKRESSSRLTQQKD